MSHKVKKLIKECDLTSELWRRARWSPDFPSFRKLENIPVFVYGQEMTGRLDHNIVKESQSLGMGYTVSSTFLMEQTQGKGCPRMPIAFKTFSGGKNFGKILGEIYLVSPEVLLTLDEFHRNNDVFKREKTYVFLMDQVTPTKSKFCPNIKCWTYFGETGFWEDYTTGKCTSSKLRGHDIYDWKMQGSTSFETESFVPDFLKPTTTMMRDWEDPNIVDPLPF